MDRHYSKSIDSKKQLQNKESDSHVSVSSSDDLKIHDENSYKDQISKDPEKNYNITSRFENNPLLSEDNNDNYFMYDEFNLIDLDADYSLDSQDQFLFDSLNELVLPQRGNFRKKSSKRKVVLSEKEQDFKFMFYHIFSNKKKFKKELVKEIHDSYLQKYFHFRKMTREETRQIDIYFQNYSQFQNQIIRFLKEHKLTLLQNIVGLPSI